MLERLINLDTKLFLFLNSIHSPVWDKIMVFISGKIEWLPLYLLLLTFIVVKFKWKSLWIILAIGVLITLTDQISTEIFKKGIERLRPTHNETIGNLVHTVNNYKGGLYGFVSSHAANSFALAVFFSLIFKKKWVSFALIFWACMVSYSRIYLGVHYPGDIIGGALLGALLAFLIYYIFDNLLRRVYMSRII